MENSKNPLAAVLAIVSGLLVLWFFIPEKGILIAAVAVGIVSLLFPFIAEQISFFWFKLSDGLGWISSKLILGIVFYLFLTPVSLLKRIFGRPAIRMKATGASCYVERNKAYSAEDFTKPW